MKKGGFVYRFFTQHGELLYVGCTHDFESRLKQHRRGTRWFHEVGNYVVRQYRQRAHADYAEAMAIAMERPKYNVQGNIFRSRP